MEFYARAGPSTGRKGTDYWPTGVENYWAVGVYCIRVAEASSLAQTQKLGICNKDPTTLQLCCYTTL